MGTEEKHLNSSDHQEERPRTGGCLSEPLNWMLSVCSHPCRQPGTASLRLLSTSRCCPRGQGTGDRGHKSQQVLTEPFLCDDLLLTMPFCCMKCYSSPRPRKAHSQPGSHPLGRSREEPPVRPALRCRGAAPGEHRGSVEMAVLGPQSSGGGVSCNSLQISGIIKI